MFVSINPATGQPFATYPEHDATACRALLSACHQAYQTWRDTSLTDRLARLTSLADLLDAHAPELGALATREMGKRLVEAEAEVRRCARVCRFYAKKAPQWLAEEIIDAGPSRRMIAYQPLGVILAVMPWNFPYWQICRTAAPLLAAGNVVAVKPAPNAAGTAAALESLAREAGFPEGAFTVLRLDTPLVAEAVAHPAVRGVTLTGSPAAGAAVGALAGGHGKKAVMELGGSDPFIILADASLDSCCSAAASARLRACGQACIAAKRFIVEAPLAPTFTDQLADKLAHYVCGDPMDPATTIGPLAREDLLTNLDRQVRDSIAQGARCVTGGYRLDRPGFFYAPTLLTDVKPGMPAFDEELFGPVAAVTTAADTEDAIRLANATSYGLGASLWTADTERGLALARRIEAGMVAVNTVLRSDFRLPFGGVKGSGYGRELSRWGLLEFVNVKTLVVEEP